jgi:hypothetical protein
MRQVRADVKSSHENKGAVESIVPQQKTKPITTLRDVHLVYDYEDTRGYAAGFEEATITVSKLPVVVEGGTKKEIPFQDITRITMQASKRKHPEVDHWDIRFLNAVITLRNQKTVRCEIGSYLPLPKSGNKPTFEIYNTTNIRDVYLSGKMIDTGLTAKVSLYDIQNMVTEIPGNSLDSLGTVNISPRVKESKK